MSFDRLSNEAKLLFVIGEPLRRMPDLDSDGWIARTAFHWVRITEKDVDDFRVAFAEVSDWLNAKSKKVK